MHKQLFQKDIIGSPLFALKEYRAQVFFIYFN